MTVILLPGLPGRGVFSLSQSHYTQSTHKFPGRQLLLAVFKNVQNDTHDNVEEEVKHTFETFYTTAFQLCTHICDAIIFGRDYNW